MKNWLKSILGFTPSERVGVITILVLAGCYFWLLLIQDRIAAKFSTYSFDEFQTEIQSANQTTVILPNLPQERIDLNKVSSQQLMELGANDDIANRIVKYRNAKEGFSDHQELLKVYGMDSALYRSIKDHSFVSRKHQSNQSVSASNEQSGPQFDDESKQSNTITQPITESITDSNSIVQVAVQFDSVKQYDSTIQFQKRPSYLRQQYVTIKINQASAEEWQELYGIGPTYSQRIVQFRDALGGFYDIYQVAETFRLPDSVFLSIQDYLELEPNSHTQKDINQIELKDLAKHPYLNYRQAKMIHNYVQQHQPISKISELYNIIGLDSSKVQKIIPYFKVVNGSTN